ncbi:hypothetical protein COX08_01685 [Candidatus Beckwithbacteria bacterium CG23_combo_of_CG06-09_8_20_14_all_34_8]|uniref:L-threonylcarbamoyladenylate synthase n=1 Tax=Candidatus Beckwithbacteria bacterium CG23_combo_of_CG06-09_8_20_14_all_34_8 TaxID=1974497 RepID=A0A2H0B6N6_9BACT|nr:MAG: hypothetical protein COX08_01685 [Candidatus Beckwithbacteria bacterium CG23_combo_of_CG06-09_8_20_14_all_34_8]
MTILSLDEKTEQNIIKQAIKILESGGLVVYPTETCYGLAADATNQEAINKLLSYKRRREGKPLSVLVDSKKTANKYVEINESASRLYERFLPGPMTVISKAKKNKLAEGITSELGTLGIRISSHPFAMALSKAYGEAITATSANASWQKKPYSIDDILNPLSEKQITLLDLIIDSGKLPKNEASTVVDTTLVDTMIVRSGDINLGTEAIELISDSELETKELAKRLCLKYWDKIRRQGLVFALIGDLGTGKTIFAKGVGEFLHIQDEITSPSYTLANEYLFNRNEVDGYFFHLDPWRLENFAQVTQLGLNNMVGENKILAIEWANKFLPDIKEFAQQKNISCIEVSFEQINGNKRKLQVVENGNK